MAQHPLRRLAAHPADEILHLGVPADPVRAEKFSGQLLVGEQGMELAMAGAVQVSGLGAAVGSGPPVVAVDALAGEQRPAADGAGTQTARGGWLCSWYLAVLPASVPGKDKSPADGGAGGLKLLPAAFTRGIRGQWPKPPPLGPHLHLRLADRVSHSSESGLVQGMPYQILQGDKFQGGLMGGRQDHRRGHPRRQGFPPAQGAQTPAVSRF